MRPTFKRLLMGAFGAFFFASAVTAAEIYDLDVVDASNTARFPEGMVASQVNDSARALEGMLARHYTTEYGRNKLINGGFRVAQRGTSFTSATTPANDNDTYLLDRWILLSDGDNAADVTQVTTVVPTGAYTSILLDVETVNVKFGILQVLEHRDAAALIGGTASLSFQARSTGTGIDHLRAAVIAWDSTADTVTSDVVSVWGVAGTDPTLVANWTYENTPANLATLTTSFQTFRIENISIDTASTTNVAVFIWTDDVTTVLGNLLYISEVQLEPGNIATSFERQPFGLEALNARRFTWVPSLAGADVFGIGQATSGTVARILIPLPTTMRASPSLTVSAAGDFDVTVATGGAEAVTGLTLGAVSVDTAELNVTVAANLAAGNATRLRDDGGGNAVLTFDSEL